MKGKELTPQEKLKAETEHAECIARWKRKAEKSPGILLTMHGIEAHFPPEKVRRCP
jgi:hypothetical protein